jgi:hypothetical protein
MVEGSSELGQVVRFMVEVWTSSNNIPRLEEKLKREMELMYGDNVQVFRELRWGSGESKYSI